MRVAIGAICVLALTAAASCVQATGKPNVAAVLPEDVSRAVVDSLRQRSKVNPIAERLATALDQTDALLARLEQEKIPAGGLSDESRMLLEGQVRQLTLIAQETSRYLSDLADSNSLAGGRGWQLMSERLATRFARVIGALDAVRQAKPEQVHRTIAAARRVIYQVHGRVTAAAQAPAVPPAPQQRMLQIHPSVNEKPATSRPAYLATWEERRAMTLADNGTFGPTLEPVPAEAAACSYTSADLAATPDIPLTQEIRDLAQQLEYDPRKIYQWVYENIRFEPYWGSMKGAQGTLWSLAGGPTDQASLTIALLRASNIPARYVRGTIVLNGDRGHRWFGAKTDMAAAIIAAAGSYPTHAVATGGGLFVSHVWVEVCVPYGNYRGTRNDVSGNRWIPLDPSFKEQVFQNGIATSVAFDYTTYMAKRTDELPHEHYAKQVEAAIKSMGPNFANNTLDQVPYSATLVKHRWDVLPISLPYGVFQYNQWDLASNPTAEASSLPAGHRYQLDIAVRTAAKPPVPLGATYQGKLPDLAFKRITVSFKGFDATNDTNLNAWRRSGTNTFTPPATISVLPVIKVDGAAVSTGTVKQVLTARISVALAVSLPELTALGFDSQVNSTAREIGASDYAAVIAYALQGSDRLFTQRAKQLQDAIQATSDPIANIDAVEGEFLFYSGLRYAYYISEMGRYIGALSGFSNEPGPHLGLASSRSQVQNAFDEPLAVGLKGTLVDVQASPSRMVKLDETDPSSVQAHDDDLFRFFLYCGSAFEHYIWQETARIDAVSTVRGLQWAAEKGIPIRQFSASDISTRWATEMDASMAPYKDQIIKALLPGGFVRVPSKTIAYIADGTTLPWKGAIWEMNNPDQIAMTISGGFNGGYGLTIPLDVWDNYLPNPTLPPVIVSQTQLQDILYGNPPSVNGLSSFTASAADPVNMLTGNMYHIERDLAIKGRGGLPIVFERTYNSRNPTDGPLGFGWTHSFNHFLRFYGVSGGAAKVSWVDGTGAERFFSTTKQTSGNITVNTTLTNQAGVYVTFTRNATGTYSIREKNGLTYTFETKTAPATPPAAGAEPKARLLEIRDRNGNKLTLSYAAMPNLTVTDDLNRVLTLKHNAQSRIYEVTDWTGRRWDYEYAVGGNLVIVRNPLVLANQQPPLTYEYYSAAPLNHAMKRYVLPRGNSMAFEYYLNGKVLRHYTTLGEINAFHYNDFRREATVVDERMNSRTFFFDQNGSVVRVVEENGAEYSYTYADPADAFRRTSQRTPDGAVTNYTYDAAGNVTQIVNPSGNTLQLSNYNAFAAPGKVKDANGIYRLSKFDAKGNTTDTIVLKKGVGATTDPTTFAPTDMSQIASWAKTTYDSVGNVQTVQRVRGYSTSGGAIGPTLTYNYDAGQLNVLSLHRCGDRDGDGAVSAAECDDSPAMVYDALGRQTTGLTGDWYVTQTQYDDLGRILRATDAIGNWRDFQYDENGNAIGQSLTQAVNGLAAVRDSTATSFDLSDRKERSFDAAGNVTLFQYDPAGNVTKVVNPDGYWVAFDYDSANRAVRAYDEQGNAVSRRLGLDGRTLAVTDPNGGMVSYEYYGDDRDRRLKRTVDPVGRSTVLDYDANGNAVSVTDNLGHVTLSFYDELNRAVRVAGPQYTDRTPGAATNGAQIRPVSVNRFDALGNLVEVKAGYTTDLTGQSSAADVLKTQMSYAYDDFGRKIKSTDGNGKSWSYQYDANNNLILATDAKGQKTNYVWDYGHQLRQRIDGGQTTASYVRNALGQVLTAGSPEVTYSYTYDVAHRLASVTDSRGNKTLTYSYSPGGRLNQLTADDIGNVWLRYDPVGRLTTIWDSLGSYVAYSYDAGGRLQQKWLSNGAYSQYTWDIDNTLTALTNGNYDFGSQASSAISQHNYHYSPLGQRDQSTEQVGSYTRPSQVEGFAYDPIGNRTQRSAPGIDQRYSYDNANQLTALTDGAGNVVSAMVYDANGNLTKKCWGGGVNASATECSGASVLSLTYGTDNRVAVANAPGASESYGYDDQGRRIRKTANGQTTYYLYNGQNIIAEYVGDWSQANAMYLQGPGTDNLVVRYQWNATTQSYDRRYYHSDGLGSVVALTDEQGTLTGSLIFDAWGNRIGSASNGEMPNFGYTGREPDATGLVYYRARYYDPSIGRFAQRDPIGLRGGPNQYAYVANDPVNLIDSSGLLPQIALPGDVTYYSSAPPMPQQPILLACGPACAGVLQGTEIATGAAVSSTVIPGYQGLQQRPEDLLLTTPASAPQSLGSRFGGFVNGAYQGLREAILVPGEFLNWISGGLIFNQSTETGPLHDVVVPSDKYPEAASHIQDAQNGGQPQVLTIDRGGAAGRRAEAMQGQPVVPGSDRDEYPPARFGEGGRGASVRPIDPRDNRGAGACIGAQCRDLPDGTRIRIVPR